MSHPRMDYKESDRRMMLQAIYYIYHNNDSSLDPGADLKLLDKYSDMILGEITQGAIKEPGKKLYIAVDPDFANHEINFFENFARGSSELWDDITRAKKNESRGSMSNEFNPLELPGFNIEGESDVFADMPFSIYTIESIEWNNDFKDFNGIANIIESLCGDNNFYFNQLPKLLRFLFVDSLIWMWAHRIDIATPFLKYEIEKGDFDHDREYHPDIYSGYGYDDEGEFGPLDEEPIGEGDGLTAEFNIGEYISHLICNTHYDTKIDDSEELTPITPDIKIVVSEVIVDSHRIVYNRDEDMNMNLSDLDMPYAICRYDEKENKYICITGHRVLSCCLYAGEERKITIYVITSLQNIQDKLDKLELTEDTVGNILSGSMRGSGAVRTRYLNNRTNYKKLYHIDPILL